MGMAENTRERGREQAGMSREGRRMMEKVLENTVRDTFLLSYPSPSLFVPSVSVLCFRLILSAFHIRIRPVFSEFQPRLYYFRYCSAITPISPTPSHPVSYYLLFFIVL